jgi:hypothetical protein
MFRILKSGIKGSIRLELSARKKTLVILAIMLAMVRPAVSQDLKWKAGLFSFFDNNEFGGSAFAIPQTMGGVLLTPEIGIRWDSVHLVSAGISLLHEFGSVKTINSIHPVAYYYYNSNPVRFMMGAFPRDYAVGRYPRVFFRDSVSYYRPTINGMSLEFGRGKSYFNIWLDWSSRQTLTEREAFLVGFSGRYNTGPFFIRHFNYMYHFSGYLNPQVEEALHDNILMLSSAGLDLSEFFAFDRLEISGGWLGGFERARADQSGWIRQNGFLAEAVIEYKVLGLNNSFYKGDGLYHFYSEHGNELYLGDPLYRSGTYNRTDLILRFLRKRRISLDLTYSLHFAESSVYHEQALKARIDLNNW